MGGLNEADELLLDLPADDEGNARSAVALFGNEFAYCAALGWMHWTGTHWKSDPSEAEVDRAILAVLKQRRVLAVNAGKEAIVKATPGSRKRVNDAKGLFRSFVAVEADEFDAYPDLLNVANGVLDLRTQELLPHDPRFRFTYCIEVPYEPSAESSIWEAFLAEAVQNGPGILAYLQMVVGYMLTGHTNEECLWYAHGPMRSGKGTFTETLLRLLGLPLAIEVDFATFTAKREGDTQNFDLAPLKPARLIVTSESNRYEALNTGKVKQLTGGNYIRCAFKHRAHFTYRPQFKAWLVSNHQVSADVDDDALWYRVKVISFPNSHAGAEDKRLKDRLREPAVLSGVLRWAVDGAAAWYASPVGLVHPTAIQSNTQEHRGELDMLGAWIDERCEIAYDTYTAHSVLYTNYLGWCKDNGVEPKKAKGFSQGLKGKGLELGLKKVNGDVFRIVNGLRLR
ncbi:MAG: DNA primase family protein [Caldilineaceae bacterium]